MVTYYIAVLLTITFLVFINASSGFVLTTYLQIHQDYQGSVTGDLAFYNELVVIATAFFWGTLSDKLGRRWIYSISFVIIGISMYLYSLAPSLGVLILFRLVFALGASGATAMLSAVLGDYVHLPDRGKASGVVGLSAGFGACLAVFVFMKIPHWIHESFGVNSADSGHIMYMAVAVVAALSSLYLLGGLQRHRHAERVHHQVPFLQLIQQGFKAGRNPILALAYGAGFGARGDSVIVTTFLSLWVNKAATNQNYSEPAALARAGTVSGIAQVCAILFAPLAGLIIHKMNRLLGLALLSAIAAFGYTYIFFWRDPMNWWILIGVCLLGCGEIGLVVSSTALVAEDAPSEIRGSVSGFFGLCGSLGILVATKVGGVLFDKWTEGGPFLLFGILNGVLVVWALATWVWTLRNPRQDREGGLLPE